MKNLIILILPFLTLTTCIKKDCNVPNEQYEFEIPATLFPAKITYKIGDTITVVSRFPHQVYERNTERTYDLTDYKFNPTLDIWELSNEEEDKTVLNDFIVLVDTSIYNFQKYAFSSSERIIYEGEYLNKNGAYTLEYQFIPTKTGLFLFSHSSFSGSNTWQQPFPEKCDDIISFAWVNLNAGEDNNPQLLLESGSEYYRTKIYERRKDDFNGFGNYMFYVEE